MQTNFTEAQLAQPEIQDANNILRNCVHCGFCLSACPTYSLLGDERDSPRGRIYMIKDMLETGGTPKPEIVHHVDRCLSCLACMTACPSGVHYQHYVDHARVHIERHHVRPLADRWLRKLISAVLPYPGRVRVALRGAALAKPFAGVMRGGLKALLDLTPKSLPAAVPSRDGHSYAAEGQRKLRVALLPGCVQDALRPSINDATIRLLTRLGVEVVVAPGTECCGALTHHLGNGRAAMASLGGNVSAWLKEIAKEPLDAIVTNAAGCGTVVKDYGHMAKTDGAREVADLTRDISQVLTMLGPVQGVVSDLPAVAYQDACSLKNGQGVTAEPRDLLRQVGFEVRELADGGTCCGSAGSYNILQPDIANALAARKGDAVRVTGADIVATGNIGCLTQMRQKADLQAIHTVELLDWATGGPDPRS